MHRIVAIAFVLTALTACSSTKAREKTCRAISEKEISALFDRWNNSLQSGDPHRVVNANYAMKSILRPDASSLPLLTPEAKEAYFKRFLEKKPSGEINSRVISINCNTATDTGTYTFTFQNDLQEKASYAIKYRWETKKKKWLIISHESSVLPE